MDKRVLMEICDEWLSFIGENYDVIKRENRAWCESSKGMPWDEDVFQDTIVKCYESIRRNGLKRTSPQDKKNYLFKSFKMNLLRERQYPFNARRDRNCEDVGGMYERWYNSEYSNAREKLVSDLWKDFATLYVLTYVDDHFPADYSHTFKLKLLCGYTYRQLKDRGIELSRTKVLAVKNYLKDNLSRDDVRNAFYEIYGELIIN